MRKSYNLVIELFGYFYILWQKLIWPILVIILEEKIYIEIYFLSQTKLNQRCCQAIFHIEVVFY